MPWIFAQNNQNRKRVTVTIRIESQSPTERDDHL